MDKSCVPYPGSQNQFWAWMGGATQADHLTQLEVQELQRARTFFGEQFTPQALDLETFANCSNFGLTQDFITDLHNSRAIIAKAASRVLRL